MDTQSFYIAELLMDAALQKEFKFTTQQAVNYIFPRLSGPPKRRESAIKSAIKRGLKEELYLECGDQYHLALPPIDFIQDTESNIRMEIDTDWDMSEIIITTKRTDSRQSTKKKPSSKKDQKGIPTRIEEKKMSKQPKVKKVRRVKNSKKPSKMKAILNKTKASNSKIEHSPKRRSKVRSKRNDRTKESTSVMSNEELSDLSKCMMSLHSLDKMSQRKSSCEDEEMGSQGAAYMETAFSNEASSTHSLVRKQSEISGEEVLFFDGTKSPDCKRSISSTS